MEKLNDGPYESRGITWINLTGNSSFSYVLCFNSKTSGVESFLSPLEELTEILKHITVARLKHRLSHPSNIWHKLFTSIPPIMRNFLRLHTCGFSSKSSKLCAINLLSPESFQRFRLTFPKLYILDNWRLRQFQHDELSWRAEKEESLSLPKRSTLSYFVSELHLETWLEGELSLIFLSM